MYNKEFTPDRITELKPKEIFVFGSNLAGAHVGGVTWQAYNPARPKILCHSDWLQHCRVQGEGDCTIVPGGCGRGEHHLATDFRRGHLVLQK